MKFGASKELITPNRITHMGGYGSLYGEFFDSIHDELYVKTLLLEDGNEYALLITLDLLFHDRKLTEQIEEYVQKKYGIKKDYVIVSYTHNHYGPAVRGYDPDQFSPEYEDFLFDRLKSCIDKAFLNVWEGVMSYCEVEGDWNISRRKIKDGKCIGGPFPQGDKDNTLTILKFTDIKGKIKALFLNYSCHPVTHSAITEITSEYPGRLCQYLETKFYGCTAMFFQGAGGDTRPKLTCKNDKFINAGYIDVDEMALGMALRVENALFSNSFTVIKPNLSAVQFDIPLDLEIYPKEYFEEVYTKLKDGPLKNECHEVIKKYDNTDNKVYLHGGILKLDDDFHIFHLGGEICYDVKLQLQKAFEALKIIFIGFCDCTAYIPSDRIIQEGGYEAEGSVIEYMLKGKFAPGIDLRVYEYFNKYIKSFN